MIIWGYKGYQKNLGQTQSSIECANCHNVTPWEIIETGRKFTLYWIPTFPYGRKHYLTCPVCQYGKQIEKVILSASAVATANNVPASSGTGACSGSASIPSMLTIFLALRE